MRTSLVARVVGGALVTLAVAVACTDPLGLLDPSVENRVDTLSLWAASGTSLERPSGYAVEPRRAVRTDASDGLDFVFDVDASGQARLLPRIAIDLPPPPSGVMLATEPFASITLAPEDGYEDSVAVPVDVDDVAFIRARPVQCFPITSAPLYAKLHVLTIDLVERRMDFEILTNVNCGYRSLAPGLPTR